jgi:hypothetical protein
MTIFSEFGFRASRVPRLNARYFALEHLVSIHATTSDLRRAMLELVLRSSRKAVPCRSNRCC